MHQPTPVLQSVDASTDCKTLHTRKCEKTKMKYGIRLTSSTVAIKMEVHHFIFFLRRQNGLKYINKYVRFLKCLIFLEQQKGYVSTFPT